MNLAGFLATPATATATRHEMPLNPSSSASFLLSSLRRSLVASLRKASPAAAAALSPMASASTVAAENGAAKAAAEKQQQQPVQVAKRLEKFKTTIFTQMSMLAIKHGAINLGQGFPNFDGPDFVKEAAIQAINAGKNQYARGYGVPELNSAIAERFLKDSGLQVDPEKEVTVTSGCTEAIAATILGLINPGDEVILFAPFYDSYEATLSMAGANVKAITLCPPDFSVPLEELKAAVSKNTRAIMINTPHNPTGKMFTREELEFIATLCKENDVLLFADEVYDKLAFEADHISMKWTSEPSQTVLRPGSMSRGILDILPLTLVTPDVVGVSPFLMLIAQELVVRSTPSVCCIRPYIMSSRIPSSEILSLASE